jgi:chromosome segregation ATPase
LCQALDGRLRQAEQGPSDWERQLAEANAARAAAEDRAVQAESSRRRDVDAVRERLASLEAEHPEQQGEVEDALRVARLANDKSAELARALDEALAEKAHWKQSSRDTINDMMAGAAALDRVTGERDCLAQELSEVRGALAAQTAELGRLASLARPLVETLFPQEAILRR